MGLELEVKKKDKGVLLMKKKEKVQSKKMTLARNFKKNCWLYIFVLPAILWYVIFQYIPMGGIVIAFKRYTGVLSIWDSPWVGLKWFKSF